MKPRLRSFLALSSIGDLVWYYLYHKPRYTLDKRYRKQLDDFEEMLRNAYKQAEYDYFERGK
jgi:hypothetical protein